jgi:hypothetical protein
VCEGPLPRYCWSSLNEPPLPLPPPARKGKSPRTMTVPPPSPRRRRQRPLRAGIDYAVCTSTKRPTSFSPGTRPRKRRRLSKSSPPPTITSGESCRRGYRTLKDLPQETLHQILANFAGESREVENAATLLAVAGTCRRLYAQTNEFAASVLSVEYGIAQCVGRPVSHLARQISSVCVHCTLPVINFRREAFSGVTCCGMCDSRHHTKISEQRAIRDYHLSKRQLAALETRIFAEHHPSPPGSPSSSRHTSPSPSEAERIKYRNDANTPITVYLESDVVTLATKEFRRPVYPTLRTTRGLDENWAILQRTFEQNGIFISPAMYRRWTVRKKASPNHHHIARDIKLLHMIFEDIPFPDKFYNLWWRERFSGWMAMNLATSMEDDDTRIQFHELFERTFNRKPQTRTQILEKWRIRERAWPARASGGVRDEPWNIVHFPAYISCPMTSSPGTAAAKKKSDRENSLLWEKYLITVRKVSVATTHFEFVLNEPAYWNYIGAGDARVSLETMIERCLLLAHRSSINEGDTIWTTVWEEGRRERDIEIGSRLRFGRGQKPVVHHFGGVSV